MTADRGFAHAAIDTVVADPATIDQRVRELGAQITRDYRGVTIHVVAVLKGSIAIVADLLRAIDLPLTVDFIAVSSYGPQTRGSGAVRLLKDLEQSLAGRHVLVLEDVIDTGLTLNYILRILRGRHPASLAVATLIDKPAHRLIELPLRYVGFTLPDIFVVGYGLDYLGRYRNLPYLGTLKRSILEE